MNSMILVPIVITIGIIIANRPGNTYDWGDSELSPIIDNLIDTIGALVVWCIYFMVY